MTTEELLKPRYKVIADYPQHGSDDTRRFIIGDVLQLQKVNSLYTYRRIGRCGYMSVGVPTCAHPENYPAIFRKLEWWEDRKPEDYPKYVKNYYGVFKVQKWGSSTGQLAEIGPEYPSETFRHLKNFKPATLEEYKTYLATSLKEKEVK